jgi:hypothetical protein
MRLESITLHLRPRRPYEAMDLGVRLMQRNAGAVYRAWIAFVVPLCLAALTLLSVNSSLAVLVIWWLKPLYDRMVLFVLARAVFGEPTDLRDVSASWRSLIGNGLIWALTFRRFDFARSFMLPVYMLEGLKGKRRRERSRVLQKNTRGNAVLLTVAYVHIEQALVWSAVMLLLLLVPQYSPSPFVGWFSGEEPSLAASLIFGGVYIVVLAVVEPFYVASGFTLYLNRRVALEAWDIELDLRRNIPEQAPLAAAAE